MGGERLQFTWSELAGGGALEEKDNRSKSTVRTNITITSVKCHPSVPYIMWYVVLKPSSSSTGVMSQNRTDTLT